MKPVIKPSTTPRFYLFLLMGGVTIFYVIGALVLQGQTPSDGALWMDFSTKQVHIVMGYEPHGALRAGDQIVSIEGVAVTEWMERALRNENPAAWKTGQELHYQIMREGELQPLLIELRFLPTSRLLLLRFGIYLLTALSLGVGTYSLYKQPHSLPARLLFLATLSLVPPLLLHIQVGLLTRPALFIAQNAVKILARSLLASAFLHLTLIFPRLKIPPRYQHWLIGLHFIPPTVAIISLLLTGLPLATRLIISWQAVTWLALGMLIASVANVIHTYYTTSTVTIRNQIRWMGWGAAVGGLPYILLTGLPEALLGHAFVNLEITAFFLLGVPLSLAIAIAKYRIFDIDALVRRSILYLLFIILLAGTYQFIVIFLEYISGQLAGQVNESLIIFIATFSVVTLFWNLQERVGGLVGRLFYHARGDPRLMLNEMSAQLSREIDFDAVVALLAETIPQKLGASGAHLWVWEEAEECFVSVREAENLIPLVALPDQWSAAGGQPIRLSLPPDWLSEEILNLFAENNLALIFPLMLGGRMIGIWGLGTPPLHSPYTTSELRALQTLAYQAANAVQNADLVRRLEEYSEDLRHQVLERTRALEEERNRLNAILQNMVDGLLVVGKNGKILLVNAAFERIIRYSSRRIVGRPVAEVLTLTDLTQLIERAFSSPGRAERVDLVWREHIFRTSAVALGNGSAVIALLRDVTREVEVDRLKSDFISGISHELRTPLTSILGFTKLIQRTFDRTILDALPMNRKIQRGAEQIQQNLEIMLTEGERLTALINDVLEVSALESGRVEWHDKFFDLTSLLRQVVANMRPAAEEKGLTLKLSLAQDLPAFHADPERIQQVLQQLLSNAIKFTAEGSIEVEAQVIAADQPLHGGTILKEEALLVAVRDTGAGIPAESHKQLFERFQQFGDVMHSKPRGAGLGLVICHEIVTHYGGDIWVESAEGEGSIFTFYLPFRSPEVESLVSETTVFHPDDNRQDTSPLVLVVDDDQAIRSLLRQELTAGGLNVQTVASGGEAVAQARLQSPALILLDFQLPDISGFDVLQILKANADTASIPVVILSVAAVQKRSLELGAAAYLSKPVAGAKLLETIWSLIPAPGKAQDGVSL